MDNPIPQPELSHAPAPKRAGLIAAAVVIFLLVAGYLYYQSPSLFDRVPSVVSPTHDYLVQGVPYYGIYTYQDGPASAFSGPSEASVGMILEYWNPGENDFVQLASDLRSVAREGNTYRMSLIADYIDTFPGYDASFEMLTFSELKRLVSDRQQTPVFTFIETQTDTPASYPLGVLVIGISDTDNTVTVHDYWLGNNRTLSIDEYLALNGAASERTPVSYLVIQPEDVRTVLAERGETPPAYEARSEVMNRTAHMFLHYHIGEWATFGGNNEYAIEQFEEVLADPDYEAFFPTYFKVYANAFLAENYLASDNLAKAAEHVTAAVQLNNGLDEPGAGGWPGIVVSYNAEGAEGELNYPYVVLGDLFLAQDKTEEAREAYEKAQSITPGDTRVLRRLARLDAAE